MSKKWDVRFMEIAKVSASWSKDPDVKVGAVIVDHTRRILGGGYNGFPRGVFDLPERYDDKMVKNRMVVHAEANAILNSLGRSFVEATLYCTRFPCCECTKMIIQVGISIVVTPEPPTIQESTWAEQVPFAKQMMLEAGVIWRRH